MTNHQHFWKPREVPAGKTCLWRLGALRLWIQRMDSGWRLAHESGGSLEQMGASFVPNDVVPEGLSWETVAWKDSLNSFELRPEMPDRPVVAKPEERVIVPSGERISYYCLLPCWVRFCLGAKGAGPDRCFSAWPTRALSDTWFGDQTAGILGYALGFPAGRDWAELPIGPHHVIVPVRIENESAEHLAFERLCLRTRYLAIFSSSRLLWSSAVTVRYRGEGEASNLHYDTASPDEAGTASRMTEPAERAHRTLVGLTFSAPSRSDFRSRPA